MHLDDDTYLALFERRELGPEHFDHRGHLYMAWLHLTRYGLEEANRRVCDGIRDLAVGFGVPEKYHRTLSEALMRIMAGRLDEAPAGEGFEAFLDRNPDLVRDARAVLERHYSPARLDSDIARAGWVEPDRLPIGR